MVVSEQSSVSSHQWVATQLTCGGVAVAHVQPHAGAVEGHAAAANRAVAAATSAAAAIASDAGAAVSFPRRLPSQPW